MQQLTLSPFSAISNFTCIFIWFFQVETRLQNPTKYHVLQSQKRQLREFLEECDTGVVPVKQHLLCPPKTELKPRSAPETISTTSSAVSGSKSEVGNTSSCPLAAPVFPRSPKPKNSVPKNDAKRGTRLRKKQVSFLGFVKGWEFHYVVLTTIIILLLTKK